MMINEDPDTLSKFDKIEAMSKLLMEMLATKDNRDTIEFAFQKLWHKGFIFCGVGKNWYICEKVAKTFMSMGIPAQTLDPVHALHGDIGMIQDQNIVFISKSGTTVELVACMEYLKTIRDKGVISSRFININLNSKAPSNELCDQVITNHLDTPVYEFDEKNIIPSLSIDTIQMILDYIGVEIFEAHKPLLERYPYNHPGGSIGKKVGSGDLLNV